MEHETYENCIWISNNCAMCMAVQCMCLSEKQDATNRNIVYREKGLSNFFYLFFLIKTIVFLQKMNILINFNLS